MCPLRGHGDGGAGCRQGYLTGMGLSWVRWEGKGVISEWEWELELGMDFGLVVCYYV